ncbi:MAG: hypothetical protein V4722_00195 [Bacteroidota bacterium]
MKSKIFSFLVFIGIALFSAAQNLESFTATLQLNETGGHNYISIANKKTYTQSEAKANKAAIDLALVVTPDNGKQKAEWYNMSGKDSKIPAELLGTATLINTISLDREQFDQCKTSQDLKRMTGHITNNSLSHFASVGDSVETGVTYHCFIVQLGNGKRVLMWLDAVDARTFKVMVKAQA